MSVSTKRPKLVLQIVGTLQTFRDFDLGATCVETCNEVYSECLSTCQGESSCIVDCADKGLPS